MGEIRPTAGRNKAKQAGASATETSHALNSIARVGVCEQAQPRKLLLADAWARWRRQGAGDAASPAELELLAALDRLEAAGGHIGRNLLVLCSACRRTRDDGEWVGLEAFLTEKAGLEFSHGLCPDCMGRLYPRDPAEPD